nr:hypothetical protein REQ54_01697 [Rhizobium sp. Q54]
MDMSYRRAWMPADEMNRMFHEEEQARLAVDGHME